MYENDNRLITIIPERMNQIVNLFKNLDFLNHKGTKST